MRRICYLYFLTIVSVIFLTTAAVFSQEGQSAQDAPMSPSGEEAAIYGEVKSVDIQSGILKVQYYDYDSDDEKTVEIKTDKNTKMENAQAVTDIKDGDWVDVIYTAGAGGNVARSVIVEKEEELSGDRMQKELPEEE